MKGCYEIWKGIRDLACVHILTVDGFCIWFASGLSVEQSVALTGWIFEADFL